MVSRSTAELRLLGALAQAGAAGASREQLTRAAGIGYATFYRQVKGLLGQGILLEQEGRYRLDLSGPYGLHFKLWHDMELLYRLAPPVRSEVLGHLRQARQDLGPHLLALWLVGSAAHGTHGPGSDLDFLAVVDRPSSTDYRLPALHPVHFVVLSAGQFRQGVADLEPFPLIALRHGLLLFDRGFAQQHLQRDFPIQRSGAALQATRAIVQGHRERLLFLVQTGEVAEARAALRSQGTTLAWLMLQALGELPRNRAEALVLCRRLLGPGVADLLQALVQGTDQAGGLLELERQAEDLHSRFLEAATQLQEFANLLYARPVEAKALLRRLLVAGQGECHLEVQQGPSGIDFEVRHGPQRILVDLVAREGELEPDRVDRLAERVQALEPQGRAVMVAHLFRSLPLADRPLAFPQQILSRTRQRQVHLVSLEELLQAHNRVCLEVETGLATWRALLGKLFEEPEPPSVPVGRGRARIGRRSTRA